MKPSGFIPDGFFRRGNRVRVLGIISEYNPLHNGHVYQMNEARKQSGADALVCVMSGNYVQRGEAAVADKWLRTRMALACGADLVVEIPTLFAMSGAQSFAQAGVRLALASGIDILSFGCETADFPLLRLLADFLAKETKEYKRLLHAGLAQGKGFAVSRGEAVQQLLGNQAAEALVQPGVILGVEYLMALQKYGAEKTEVYPVQRIGSAHGAEDAQGEYISASAIRRRLRAGLSCEEAMPQSSGQLWQQERMPDPAVFTRQFYWKLAEKGERVLAETPEIGEGLENRIARCAKRYCSMEELVQEVSCKRYPAARIRRGLMNFCLGITEETRRRVGWENGPSYLRILGIGPQGEALLKRIREKAELPILTQPAGELADLTRQAQELFREETRYTDYYTLALPGAMWQGRGREYHEKILKNKENKR